MLARQFRKMSRVVLAVVIAAMATVLSHAPRASATTGSDDATTTLPGGFDGIITDPTTHRVFVSDVASLAITVFDENGALVGHLDPAGPGAMVVHDGTLYTASAHYTSIFKYDTSSLQATALRAQNQVLSPAPALAWANGQLWTTTGDCHAGAGQLMSVDPNNPYMGGGTVVYDPVPGLTGCVDLVSSPTEPNMLVGFEPGAQFIRLVRLDVSTGAPVVQAESAVDCYNPEQIAFTSDGSSILAACGSPYQLIELSSDTLQETGRVYQTGAYPGAIAIDPRFGQIAAGNVNQYDTDVRVFQPGASSPSWTQDYNGNYYPQPSLVSRGLAWHADGNTLYAVTKDSNNKFELHVIAGPTSSTLAASPSTIDYGQSTTLTATVQGGAPGEFPPDGDVTFTDGTTVLGHAQLNGGTATLVASTLAVGSHSVVASFDGTRAGAPSVSAPLTVQVQPARSTTTLEQWSGYEKSLPGGAVRLTVTVTPAADYDVAQGTVTVYDGDKALTTETVYGGVDYPIVTLYDVGVHHLRAVYSGEANIGPSTSNTVDHPVVLCQDNALYLVSSNPPQLCRLTPLPH